VSRAQGTRWWCGAWTGSGKPSAPQLGERRERLLCGAPGTEDDGPLGRPDPGPPQGRDRPRQVGVGAAQAPSIWRDDRVHRPDRARQRLVEVVSSGRTSTLSGMVSE